MSDADSSPIMGILNREAEDYLRASDYADEIRERLSGMLKGGLSYQVFVEQLPGCPRHIAIQIDYDAYHFRYNLNPNQYEHDRDGLLLHIVIRAAHELSQLIFINKNANP